MSELTPVTRIAETVSGVILWPCVNLLVRNDFKLSLSLRLNLLRSMRAGWRG